MQEIIYYYTIFALTTAIYSLFRLYMPVVDRLRFEEVNDHVYITSPTLSKFVFLTISFVIAPVLMIIVFSENLRCTVVKGMYEGSL